MAVAQQIGYSMPRLTELGVASNSDLWIAAVDRESAATAPGASSIAEEKFVGPGDMFMEGPCVMEKTATLRRMFERQFGTLSDDPSAGNKFVGSAMRYVEPQAVESGFDRRSWCVAHRSPRASSSTSQVREGLAKFVDGPGLVVVSCVLVETGTGPLGFRAVPFVTGPC